MTINPYLTFEGNCEEAFLFYRSVFGGEFQFMGRFKDMPPLEGVAPIRKEHENYVMHVSLPISEECVLMGSDTSESFGQKIIQGNNFSISILVDSREEADHVFQGLSSDAHIIMNMQETFWGSYYGMLTDQFGVQWMINCNIQNES